MAFLFSPFHRRTFCVTFENVVLFGKFTSFLIFFLFVLLDECFAFVSSFWLVCHFLLLCYVYALLSIIFCFTIIFLLIFCLKLRVHFIEFYYIYIINVAVEYIISFRIVKLRSISFIILMIASVSYFNKDYPFFYHILFCLIFPFLPS